MAKMFSVNYIYFVFGDVEVASHFTIVLLRNRMLVGLHQ